MRLTVLLSFVATTLAAQGSPRPRVALEIARLHYDGGGDWYANPSSLPNLLEAIRDQTALYAGAGDLKRFETGEKNEKAPPATDPHLRARESFVHVMFNHNDFVTIR